MKKQILILSIILSAILSLPIGEGWGGAYAQMYIPFPTDSAQWSVRHTTGSPFSQTSYQYKMKGDTVLNGIVYHKVYYSLDLAYDSPNETLHCFVREDTTKKVFAKYPASIGVDTAEFMLYDFNLVIGDSVTIRLFYFNTDSVYKLKVTAMFPYPINSIDTPIYYQLDPFPYPEWPCTYFSNLSWMDGFGSFLSPFYNEIPEWGCDSGGYEVSCFWYKGVYVWGGTYCDYSTGINEKQDIDYQSRIFPNPAQSQIEVEFDLKEPQNGTIAIKNILGQTVKIFNNGTFSKGKNRIEIDVSEFSKGLYFVHLISDSKIMSTKFVKE